MTPPTTIIVERPLKPRAWNYRQDTLPTHSGETSFQDVEADDLMEMIKALTTRSKRRSSFFIRHPTCVDDIATQKNANGDYIFRSAREGMSLTIHGYPIILSDYMPEIGDDAPDSAFLAFGNPKHPAWGDRVSREIKFYDATMYAARNNENFLGKS